MKHVNAENGEHLTCGELAVLPTPLALALDEYNRETQPFRKVHRLIDAIEVLVKLHTVIIVSDYFSRRNVSDDMKALLAAGLRTPSLGVWWQFAREFLAALLKEHAPFVNGIEQYVGKQCALFMAMEGKNNLIRFRNLYAHGATPSDAQCDADLNQYGAVFEETLGKGIHLRQMRLIAVQSDGTVRLAVGTTPAEVERPTEAEPGTCYLVDAAGTLLSLHPLLVFREDSGKFFFYNDLREKDAAILNYDSCIHLRDVALRSALLLRYPIHEWATKPLPEEFRDRVERLTETFKGRRNELQNLLNFVSCRGCGLLMIWGGPGIGKSALLARAVQAMQWPADFREEEGLTTERPLGNILTFEYFIRKGQRTADTDFLLNNINARMEAKFRTGLSLGSSTGERAVLLENRLKQISQMLKEDQRLVVLIDGLDEGVDAAGLLESLPKETPYKVFIIYASREHPRVRQSLYDLLDREHHASLSLGGLAAADVRSLLNDYVNKYEIDERYLERVVEISQGNPLYLKLLCRGLEQGDYRLNDEIHLPTEMKELYRTVINRLSGTPGACDFLRLLAVTEDYFTASMALEVLRSEIPGLTADAVVASIIPECMELLTENPLTEKVLDYQLFHESLREFIGAEFPAECRKWERRLAEWCRRWDDIALSDESHVYTVRFAGHHMNRYRAELLKNGKDADAARLGDEIIALVWNDRFRQRVFELCGNAISLQRDIRTVQALLAGKDRDGSEMASFLRLVRMFHEEPRERYRHQLEELTRRGASGSLDGVERLAMMGATARDKVLLVLRAVCQADRGRHIPRSVEEKINAWLEQANDPVLTRLWETVTAG